MTRTPNLAMTQHRSGFTLVELLLVLALLVIIGAVATSTLSGTLGGARLQQSGEQIRTVLTRARMQAIDSGSPALFQAQIGTGNFKVESATAAEGCESITGTLEEGVVFRQVNCSAVDGAPLPYGVDPPTDGEWSQPVAFMPTGVSYNADILLARPSGDLQEKQVNIALRGVTCTAKLTELVGRSMGQ